MTKTKMFSLLKFFLFANFFYLPLVANDSMLSTGTFKCKYDHCKIFFFFSTIFVAPGDVPTPSWRFLLHFLSKIFAGCYLLFVAKINRCILYRRNIFYIYPKIK